MKELNPKTTKIEKSVVDAYKIVEETVVGTYQKIEDGVVGTYQKIEDKFVDTFLEKVEPETETNEEPEVKEENKTEDKKPQAEIIYKICGQVFDTYIIIEKICPSDKKGRPSYEKELSGDFPC